MAERFKCLKSDCDNLTGSSTGYCKDCSVVSCRQCRKSFRIKINTSGLYCNACNQLRKKQLQDQRESMI